MFLPFHWEHIIHKQDIMKQYKNHAHISMHSLCVSNKPLVQTVVSGDIFVFPPSFSSGLALHHFNDSASTERHWWRAGRSSSAIAMQRATSRSILWDPLWCWTCICWLVNQRTSVHVSYNKVLGRTTNRSLFSMWVSSKDKRTDRGRLMVNPIFGWCLTTLTIH